MTAATEMQFYPRSIALARVERAARYGHYVGSGAAALLQAISGLASRAVAAYRRRQELDMLLKMDERMLKDIGLTRGEVFGAVHGRTGLDDAAARREAAMDAVHKVRTLQRVKAPAINPAAIAVRAQRKAA